MLVSLFRQAHMNSQEFNKAYDIFIWPQQFLFIPSQPSIGIYFRPQEDMMRLTPLLRYFSKPLLTYIYPKLESLGNHTFSLTVDCELHFDSK